jgi:hypothetical protein
MAEVANSAGGAQGSATESIPSVDHLVHGTRVVASHCPGCCEALDKPYVVAYYLDARLSRRIQYFLCRPCGQRLERAGRRKRKQIVETVERNLWALGVLDGLERRGGVEA